MKKLVLVIVMAASSATAQFNPVLYQSHNFLFNGMAQVAVNNSINSNIAKNLKNSNSESSDEVNGTDTSISSAASLEFSPSLTHRRANLVNFISKLRAADPKGAIEMEKLFASTDIIAALGRDLAPYGLEISNVADAYSAYWMSAWQAANQDTSDPSRATARAVSAQAAAAISATAEFQNATDAQKQEFAEALLVQAALISASQAKYKNDAALAKSLATAVRQGAKASGLDLDATTLTRAGFIPAKRTGAADPAPGAEQRALAATRDVGSRPGYGFLAAAGGAGLGVAFLIGKAMGRKG